MNDFDVITGPTPTRRQAEAKPAPRPSDPPIAALTTAPPPQPASAKS
jgi:hypothetical protein